MARVIPHCLLLCLALAVGAEAQPQAVRGDIALTLVADRDDSDADGVADAEQSPLSAARARDVTWLDGGGKKLESARGDAVRVVLGEKPSLLAGLGPKALRRFGLQGVHAGSAQLVFDGARIDVTVLELFAVDGRGQRVDLATSHASISRSLPAAIALRASDAPDEDALSWLVAGPEGREPERLGIASTTVDDKPLDQLGEVATAPTPCPSFVAPGLQCRTTPPIRATGDIIDRSHPDSAARSLRADVGGRIVVSVGGRPTVGLRVGGPRKSALGPIDRYRGRLRMRLVRLSPGGSPPIGGTDAAAVELGREEIRTTSGLWGQCGVHFGADADLDVEVVDPPPPYLIAVGCTLGLPASGGTIALIVDKKRVEVKTTAGQTPTQVAAKVAEALERVGLSATMSVNARIAPGALRTADVLVRHADGSLATVSSALASGLTTDPTLDVCLGEVDLSDGLTHFTDFDAVAGTVEERSLIKAFDDGDPTTIEVLVIPSFSLTGRIGESFIYADGGSIRNAVIIDRAGIRAGARSFAMAHELGHILLDMPGHPDDFGVDRPWSLMDADAADPTIFGPRRLSVSECERALRQSGPKAPVPLLEPWPLYEKK